MRVLAIRNLETPFAKAGGCMYVMSYLNINFDCQGVHSTGNAAEAYIFHTLESAERGDCVAAENLFFIGMYALFVTYDPWIKLD